MMTEILANIPWLALLVVFIGMALLQWRAIGALDQLARLLVPQPIPPGHIPAIIPIAPSAPAAAPKPAPAAPPISTQPVDVVDAGLVAFIKKQEGFSAKAYWDYKQYSIGYGTKASSATEVITEAEATARLTVEINAAWQLVKKIIPAGTPIGIEQALADLTYNAGPGWETAGLGTAVKASDWAKAKESILQYNHAGGVVNAGLTARREAEVSWFDNPL